MPEFKQTEAETRERVSKLFSIKGKRTVDSFHRELGKIMWDECGMARSREGLDKALEKSRKSARNSGTTSSSPAPATTPTWNSKKPAASPTSSNSAK
jgi:succinate dehydrogenase/fumarate reductase flavoprotein subunit